MTEEKDVPAESEPETQVSTTQVSTSPPIDVTASKNTPPIPGMVAPAGVNAPDNGDALSELVKTGDLVTQLAAEIGSLKRSLQDALARDAIRVRTFRDFTSHLFAQVTNLKNLSAENPAQDLTGDITEVHNVINTVHTLGIDNLAEMGGIGFPGSGTPQATPIDNLTSSDKPAQAEAIQTPVTPQATPVTPPMTSNPQTPPQASTASNTAGSVSSNPEPVKTQPVTAVSETPSPEPVTVSTRVDGSTLTINSDGTGTVTEMEPETETPEPKTK